MIFPIYLYIAFLMLFALLSTRLMKRLKLPNVTGYIITGILAGPFVFGLLFNNFSFNNIENGLIAGYVNQLGWVSNVALGFIAFSIGTSFKRSTLKAVGKRVVVITIFESLGASILVFLGTFLMHIILPDFVKIETVFTLSAIASATAPAATLMIIKQYKAKGNLVDTLLPVVALDDASALILFAILFQIAKTVAVGSSFDIYLMLFKPLLEITISIAIGVVLGFIISFINKYFKSRNNHLILCIISIFAALGFYILFKNEYMGSFELSSLLMCMVAGAIYTNFANDSGKTFDLMERFTTPIFMMFFVLSGASLNLKIFFNDQGLFVVLIALVYIIFRVAGKWVGAYTGSSITHSDEKVKKYLGLTLIPQAGVAIGLASSANQLFSLQEETKESGTIIIAIILTTTLIYEIFGPVISKYALSKAGEISSENL